MKGPRLEGDSRDVLTGEEFSQLVSEARNTMTGVAMKYMKNRPDAEDLIQATLEKAWKSRDKFQAGTNFSAWIFVIMRNTFINIYRKKKKSLEVNGFEDGEIEWRYGSEERETIYRVESVEGLMDTFSDEVREVLMDLEEGFRNVIILFMLEFTYKEIAEILDVAVGTVMSRLYRSRRHLGIDLDDFAREQYGINTKHSGVVKAIADVNLDRGAAE
jgi:RNA polymerase sigma-70 factor (ECF subfamily)